MCRKSLCFFPCKITNSTTSGRERYIFETAKGRNLEFITLMRHMLIILSANFGTNRSRYRISEPKTDIPIEGLNSSSSKTNRRRRIKVSNLEASGHAVSAPEIKL